VKFQASRAAQNLREKAAEDGVRTTEPGIKEQVRLDDAYQASKKAFFRATAQATMVEGFYRALRDKVNLGIALCYKQKEEIRVTGAKVS
jgi:phage-related tail protein